MKITTRVTQEIEMPMPLHGDDLTKAGLRALRAERQADLIAQLEADEWTATVSVVMILFCDADQRRRVSEFVGFVPAEDFGAVRATRLDFGAFEDFRFKWAHGGAK